MAHQIQIITLPGESNFAVVGNKLILFGLGASETELEQLRNEALLLLEQEHADTPVAVAADLTSEFALIPTYDCNQRCIYCYANAGESTEVLPIEMAKSAILSLKENENRKRLKLHLVGGGEPLLFKSWLFELSNYIEQLFDEVEYHIVCNGTFDKEVFEWIVNHKCVVRISYDGAMHSIQRPLKDGSSSALLVQDNIRNLVLRGVHVMVQCIVTAHGLPRLRDTIDDIASLGVMVIKLEAAKATAISRFQDGLEPEPTEYAQGLLDVIEHVFNNHPGLMVDTGYFSEPSDDSYCGMSGVNTMLTPQGHITACLEVARLGDPFADQLIYGELKGGKISLDEEKQRFLEQLTYQNQLGGCNKCNLRMMCHGGCPMEALWEHGFPLRKSSFACTVEHYLLPRLLLMMAANPEIADVVANNAEVN